MSDNESECRVCGCTADDPCPTGRINNVSCRPVPDPKGSPRLCHWCAAKEGATQCDVLAVGFLAGPEPTRCGFAALYAAHFRCDRGHDRHIKVCQMHSLDDLDIPSDCAVCGPDEVPVHTVSLTPLYPDLAGTR